VSGVFEVRASDAHAWVEVWFPETGWEAFDPTAEVPLAGDAEETSVGGDLVDAAAASISSHRTEIALVVVLLVALATAARLAATAIARRKRGRWGVLQDRFTQLSDPTARTNPARAGSFDRTDTAHALAVLLDQAVFDPEWTDSDDDFQVARATLRQLESSTR
jgi:transglutaminase-like putative cysteine protease